LKRILGSLIILVIVFVIFALITAQFRASPVSVRLPFFTTTQASVEEIAYISFFTGFFLAVIVFLIDDISLRRRFRKRLTDQKQQLETKNNATKDIPEEKNDQGENSFHA